MSEPVRDVLESFAEAVDAAMAQPAYGRALVAIAPEPEAGVFAPFIGLKANFIAHLMATAGHLPQTRTLRRAAPETATQAYRQSGPVPPDRRISRFA